MKNVYYATADATWDATRRTVRRTAGYVALNATLTAPWHDTLSAARFVIADAIEDVLWDALRYRR